MLATEGLTELIIDGKQRHSRNMRSLGQILGGLSTAMFNHNRRDRGALRALGMALVAIVLASWFSQPIRDERHGQPASSTAQNENDKVREAISGKADFDPWNDTYAQWAMMFFSFVATIISWKAVVYVHETLNATRRSVEAAEDAVAVARDIGVRQTRAYMVQSEHTWVWAVGVTDPDGIEVELSINWINSGQTPAINCSIAMRMWTGATDVAQLEQPLTWGDAKSTAIRTSVGPGEKLSSYPLPIPKRIISLMFDGIASVVVYNIVKYTDMFGVERQTETCQHVFIKAKAAADGSFPGMITVSPYPHHNSYK